MQDYTAVPPFINQTVPPLVMLLMSKDHRLFIKAYNDIMDIDGVGPLKLHIQIRRITMVILIRKNATTT